MDEFEPGAAAVDPPLQRILAVQPGRRHRRLTGLSGIVLFACMFLPAIDACGPVRPYQMPPFWPPYLYGVVFALIALAARPRGLARGIAALRGLTMLFVIGSLIVVAIVPEIGLVELGLAVLLLAIVGVSRTTERRVAICALVIAATSVAWFGLWAATPEARYGVHLSLVGALGLFAGSLVWLRELVRCRGGAPLAPGRPCVRPECYLRADEDLDRSRARDDRL